MSDDATAWCIPDGARRGEPRGMPILQWWNSLVARCRIAAKGTITKLEPLADEPERVKNRVLCEADSTRLVRTNIHLRGQYDCDSLVRHEKLFRSACLPRGNFIPCAAFLRSYVTVTSIR